MHLRNNCQTHEMSSCEAGKSRCARFPQQYITNSFDPSLLTLINQLEPSLFPNP